MLDERRTHAHAIISGTINSIHLRRTQRYNNTQEEQGSARERFTMDHYNELKDSTTTTTTHESCTNCCRLKASLSFVSAAAAAAASLEKD